MLGVRRARLARRDRLEGGRGGMGDVARVKGVLVAGDGGGGANTVDNAGRDFVRDAVGMVRRRAAGLDEGVDGRVGGTVYSGACIRLVDEFLWVFAREAAVGVS